MIGFIITVVFLLLLFLVISLAIEFLWAVILLVILAVVVISAVLEVVYGMSKDKTLEKYARIKSYKSKQHLDEIMGKSKAEIKQLLYAPTVSSKKRSTWYCKDLTLSLLWDEDGNCKAVDWTYPNKFKDDYDFHGKTRQEVIDKIGVPKEETQDSITWESYFTRRTAYFDQNGIFKYTEFRATGLQKELIAIVLLGFLAFIIALIIIGTTRTTGSHDDYDYYSEEQPYVIDNYTEY